MPVPSVIGDLSTTAASNGPAGSDLPSTVDDYMRAVQAIVRAEYDTQQTANATYAAASTLTSHTGSTTAHGISTYGATLVDDADASTARTTLGLGTIATQAASAVAITGGSVAGITDLAVADGGTGASTAAGARTNLGLGTIATAAAPAGTVVGTSDTQTLTNKTIVAASNTITTAASGDLTATELNAALAELQAAITALEAATVTVQTGYVGTSTISSSTGEDAKYVDVTITAVSAVANCEVLFFGGAGSTASVTVAMRVADGGSSTEFAYGCTARLTSTTNLRISSPAGIAAYIAGRWQVIDHGA